MKFLPIMIERKEKKTVVNVFIKGGDGPFRGVVVMIDANGVAVIRDGEAGDARARYTSVNIDEIAAIEDDL